MTDPSLIEALQEGPGSRELSDRVLRHFGWHSEISTLQKGTQITRWFSPDGNHFESDFPPDPHDDNDYDRPSPTESVDDALALVPDREWMLDIGNDECYASMNHQIEDMGDIFKAAGVAPTLALAICIAILKAHEATQASGSQTASP